MERRLQRLQIKGRIAQAREQAGLTQPELGELMQPPVHWRTVQEWESQKNENVPFGQLDRIAEVTHTTTLWLLYGTEAGLDEELRAEVVGKLDALDHRFDVELIPALQRIEDQLRQAARERERTNPTSEPERQ